MTYLPASHLITFALDADKGRYTVETCSPGFTGVPREVIVEDRRFNGDINANLILRGPNTTKKANGRKITFFTGLQETTHKGVYLGNVLTYGRAGERIRNGLIVRFSDDAGRLTLRYFPAYYPYPDARTAFVAEVVNRGLI